MHSKGTPPWLIADIKELGIENFLISYGRETGYRFRIEFFNEEDYVLYGLSGFVSSHHAFELVMKDTQNA